MYKLMHARGGRHGRYTFLPVVDRIVLSHPQSTSAVKASRTKLNLIQRAALGTDIVSQGESAHLQNSRLAGEPRFIPSLQTSGAKQLGMLRSFAAQGHQAKSKGLGFKKQELPKFLMFFWCMANRMLKFQP